MDTEYVVYAHKHPEIDEYVYIGMGKPGRMFTTTKRQPDHMIWLEDNLQNHMLRDLVVSLGVFKDKKEALKHERELIKEHQPKFNKEGVTFHLHKARVGMKASAETLKRRSNSMKKYIKENGMPWKNKKGESS